MGTKSVKQCSCDRCNRVWYEDPAQESVTEVDVQATIGGDFVEASFDCLCEGCAKAVKGMLVAITRVMAKASPIRGAKKKGGAPVAGELPATAAIAPKRAAPSKATSAPAAHQQSPGVPVPSGTTASPQAPVQGARPAQTPSGKS